MADYVRNEDGSIDILISVIKDSRIDSGCSECDLERVCKQKRFKKAGCLIESLFGLRQESMDHHFKITI